MLSKFDEIKLLAQCALGDNRDAFGQLVEAYQGELRRFLLSLTMGDHELSDDLAQETFIKAYFGVREFKGLAGFKTWLFRIAYNEFCAHHRAHHETSLEPQQVVIADSDTHAATEARLDVQKAMQALGHAERTCVTLCYIHDMPIQKISSITGMPQNTVKSHLRRAKDKMRNFLQQ